MPESEDDAAADGLGVAVDTPVAVAEPLAAALGDALLEVDAEVVGEPEAVALGEVL